MEAIDRKEYPLDRVKRLLSGVPFFNEVSRDSPDQFTRLIDRAQILQAQPDEMVIRAGESDTYLYFLLKGQLAVLAPSGQVLNYVSPGEVFGTLAMIRGTPRTASIKVDENTREAIVARLDYTDFNDLQDFHYLNLATRIAFYRMLVHNIRWTLEVNKMQNPQHELITSLRTVPIFTGSKGSAEELKALHEQAHKLADILCQWNDSAPPVRSNIQST